MLPRMATMAAAVTAPEPGRDSADMADVYITSVMDAEVATGENGREDLR